MRERGFIPFSAAGVVILMLVVAMVGQAVWSRHQCSLNTVDELSSSAILTIASSVQNDLRAAARYSVYDALWEVSKHANDYGGDEVRKPAIEGLAAGYFLERVSVLPSAYAKHDSRIELKLGDSNARPIFDLREGGDGYLLASITLPKGTRVKINSWDNSLVLELPCGSLETFIDSRYFLLQQRMRQFIDGLVSVGKNWEIMEYVSAWAGAWLGRRVSLSASRSKAFFELAWAIHELDTFGSTDYAATALGLIGATEGNSDTRANVLSNLTNSTSTITPLRAVDLETMKGYIDRALEALDEASAKLGKARKNIRCAIDEMTRVAENLDNADSKLENVLKKLKDAELNVAKARAHVLGAGQHFEQLINFTASLAEQNPVMAALHESLVRGVQGDFVRGDYPSTQKQVKWGVDDTDAKIATIEVRINKLVKEIRERNELREVENLILGFHDELIALTQELLAEPTPKRWVEFDSYAEPGSYEGRPPRPTRERIPVYLDGEEDGTIGALKIVVQNARNNFDQVEGISVGSGPTLGDIQNAGIDETLAQKLELDISGFLNVNREQLYELLPPPPIRPEPGLSVFHDFGIKRVEYRREDPAGWFGSPTPTPIPLWFIGVTLWWAQWDITLELEEWAVEEVFDFENPTLLRTHEFPDGIEVDVHKPLAYRYEVPNRTFDFRLVVISLRPFSISQQS